MDVEGGEVDGKGWGEGVFEWPFKFLLRLIEAHEVFERPCEGL